MFTPLSELTAKILRRKGFDKEVESGQILNLVKIYYKSVLPKIDVEPYKVARKQVYVKVASSVVANECYNYIEGCLESLDISGVEVLAIKFSIV